MRAATTLVSDGARGPERAVGVYRNCGDITVAVVGGEEDAARGVDREMRRRLGGVRGFGGRRVIDDGGKAAGGVVDRKRGGLLGGGRAGVEEFFIGRECDPSGVGRLGGDEGRAERASGGIK